MHPRKKWKPDAAACAEIIGCSPLAPTNRLCAAVHVEMAATKKDEGNAAFKAADYEGAYGLYSEAIELDGTNAVFFSNRAFAAIKLKRYADACKDAEQAIQLDSAYIKGYHRLGTALKELGRHEDAMRAIKAGIQASGKVNKKKKAGAASVKELKRLGHEIRGLIKAGVKELSGADSNRQRLADEMAKAAQAEIGDLHGE